MKEEIIVQSEYRESEFEENERVSFIVDFAKEMWKIQNEK